MAPSRRAGTEKEASSGTHRTTLENVILVAEEEPRRTAATVGCGSQGSMGVIGLEKAKEALARNPRPLDGTPGSRHDCNDRLLPNSRAQDGL